MAPGARLFCDYNKSSGDVVYASLKSGTAPLHPGPRCRVGRRQRRRQLCRPVDRGAHAGRLVLLIPDTFPTEPVEYLAETVLAMSHLPAAERTGLVAFGLHYPWSVQFPVHTLDGARSCLRWNHPRRPTRNLPGRYLVSWCV